MKLNPPRPHILIQLFALLLVISTGGGYTFAQDQADQQQLDFFETKIRPILIKHCFECHAADAKQIQGNLRLDLAEAVLEGGDSGPAIKPGKPDESLLLEALRYESFEMPPDGKLPDNVIADFEKWIRNGAIDPRVGETSNNQRPVNMEAGKSFWSFQPISRPSVPDVKKSSWPKNDVDRFVLARLEQSNIAPVEDADKIQLVRRVYFDLIGLPPTPEQIDDFIQDKRPDALARLVDRLLESPHFGQRWGRHWLDVARYSDSSGGGRVLIFHDAWRYRDYVIDAFNNDKPFDQFIREQVAGDLLPYQDHVQRGEQLTATGFLMLGPHNYELQDKELLRMEVVDEQIDVVGRAFLGLTLGCARCHDHKFDPIPTTDYYALAGIFRSTDSLVNANVSRFVETELPLEPKKQQSLEEHRNRIADLQQQIDSEKKVVNKFQKALADMGGIRANSLHGTVIDDQQAELIGSWKQSNNVKPYVNDGYRYASGKDAKAIFRIAVSAAGRYEILISYTPHSNRSKQVPIKLIHGNSVTEHTVNQKQIPQTNGLFHLLGSIEASPVSPITVEIHAAASGTTVIDAVQIRSENGRENSAREFGGDIDPIAHVQESLAKLYLLEQKRKSEMASAPKSPPQVMSVREHDQAEDYFVCIRGDAHRLGEPVKRHALSVLRLEKDLDIDRNASGRRQLAQWLVDPRNPLPARVYVNRVWSHLLGHGIVRTVDNFGLMGQQPSHPKLLDYLAAEFIENGWSTKSLIRELVNSRTYQLSVTHVKQNSAIDPENRLLWRQARRRLDVECIRDAILSFSGQLDRSSGGPSISADLKREFGFEYDSLRRTVYLPIFRNTLHDMLEVFDFPNPNLVTGFRNESTLPSQALYLMNSPFVREQAHAAAERLLNDNLRSDKERLELAYRRALGRQPKLREQDRIMRFLDESDLSNERQRLAAWTDICHTLIASLDFRYVQ